MEESKKVVAKRTIPAVKAPALTPANDGGDLPLAQLAAGILSREIRPRAADIRRLAEAVLAIPAETARKAGKEKKKKKKDKEPGAAKGTGKKSKKLAKIPGPKPKK